MHPVSSGCRRSSPSPNRRPSYAGGRCDPLDKFQPCLFVEVTPDLDFPKCVARFRSGVIRRLPSRVTDFGKSDSRSWSNEGTRPRVEFVDSYEGTAMSAGVIGVTPPSTIPCYDLAARHRIAAQGWGRLAFYPPSAPTPTAADIDAARITRTPGFGPATVKRLTDWRRDQELRFKFEPADALITEFRETEIPEPQRWDKLAASLSSGKGQTCKTVSISSPAFPEPAPPCCPRCCGRTRAFRPV